MLEAALDKCNGCHACYSICPVNAIEMIPNNEGFRYPIIDERKCIKCKKCEKTCAIIQPFQLKREESRAYACINKDENIRNLSSSGGIFTPFAEDIINKNGIVFGAKFDEQFNVIHDYTDTIDGLADFRGSKYVQSRIGNTYKECKKFLDENRLVLFSGTPCQIGGLKKYLAKEYDNLYTIDLICHGVPSPLVWERYRNFIEKKYASRIMKTSFRRKDCGWRRYSLSFTFINDNEYLQPQTEGEWMLTFNKNVMMRKSCYDCSFKTLTRISDITIGDFWGVEQFYPELDDDKGISLIYIHSAKGQILFEYLKECFIIKKVSDLYAPLRFNEQFLHSIKLPKNRDKFIHYVIENNFYLAFLKFVRQGLFQRCYIFVRRCLSKVKRFVINRGLFK